MDKTVRKSFLWAIKFCRLLCKARIRSKAVTCQSTADRHMVYIKKCVHKKNGSFLYLQGSSATGLDKDHQSDSIYGRVLFLYPSQNKEKLHI